MLNNFVDNHDAKVLKYFKPLQITGCLCKISSRSPQVS